MEGSADSTPPTERGPRGRSKAATRIFWGFLVVALLFSIVGISVVGVLGWKDNKAKGLVCYKAAGEKSCFLRRMEMRDMENIQSFLNMSVAKDGVLFLQNNRTRYYREFLGVIGGRKVNHELVGEPVQILCDQLPIYWVKKSEGESTLKGESFITSDSRVLINICSHRKMTIREHLFSELWVVPFLC
ncbi:BRICHOS domain-containing protein 5 isoform X3 [Phyllobates terribilis]|uniref:BRICHOS domain-containing protein 5 isoform X3 n=1 Tax=Phyllobates terribilis TaxID=111132 RepID=UPI003CCB0942